MNRTGWLWLVITATLPAWAGPLPDRQVCVAAYTDNSVKIFDTADSGDIPPILRYGWETHMDFPVSVAVDRDHGEWFVANQVTRSVTVYDVAAVGNIEPIREIRGPSTLLDPSGIAVDPQNDELFVANGTNHSILVFARQANGDVAPCG